MAKKVPNEKPEEKQEPTAEQAVEPKAESNTASKKDPKNEKKDAVIQPLAVKIEFPSIADLKQTIGMDSEGRLLIAISFKAVVDQYEIFRLINLLKQPHESIYAIIGTNQSALDFKFDMKVGNVQIIKAEKQLPAGKAKEEPKSDQEIEKTEASGPGPNVPPMVKVHEVTFNNIPEEKLPYGVSIDFVDAKGEIHTVAGRGKNATEAVLKGIAATKAFPVDLKEPFEYAKALEALDPSPAAYKLIRVIEVGSFDDKGEAKKDGGK